MEFIFDEENEEFQGNNAIGTPRLYTCLLVKGLNEMSLWQKGVDFIDTLLFYPFFSKEPEMGLEPTAYWLRISYSTNWVIPAYKTYYPYV